jgi:hypothetical protein
MGDSFEKSKIQNPKSKIQNSRFKIKVCNRTSLKIILLRVLNKPEGTAMQFFKYWFG